MNLDIRPPISTVEKQSADRAGFGRTSHPLLPKQQQKHISRRVLRPDFTSNLVHGLAFGTPKFYIATYGKIYRGFVNLSYNCDVKSGLRVDSVTNNLSMQWGSFV